MRSARPVLAVLAVATLALALAGAFAGPLTRDDRPDSDRVSEPPIGDIGGPPRLPVPIDPPTPVVAGGTLQIVGFTTAKLDGSPGVLNFTLTCQLEFPGSRMCTAEETNLTIHVPDPPRDGAAWVQMRGSTLPYSTDCAGWTTNSPGETGMAIALGQCYGGLVNRSCNERLPVACCGVMAPTP